MPSCVPNARRLPSPDQTSTTSGTPGFSAWGSFTSVLLAVLWAYYASLVFLLGGVVAETWAERRLAVEAAGSKKVD